MVLLFLSARLLRLDYLFRIHFVNWALIVANVWLTVRSYYRRANEPQYLGGLFTAFRAVVIASVVANFFLLIYLTFVNPYYMHMLREGPLGAYLSPLIIALALFTEQIAAGIIVALIVMQLHESGTRSE
jgi:hypothetical protein